MNTSFSHFVFYVSSLYCDTLQYSIFYYFFRFNLLVFQFVYYIYISFIASGAKKGLRFSFITIIQPPTCHMALYHACILSR